ncbi:MAG: hypothetical protein DHS20C02_10670 [Micavibrio sp.]|nr:MAG: hypothetical protein DHS20C02_10670 [Micavibrio sp.]
MLSSILKMLPRGLQGLFLSHSQNGTNNNSHAIEELPPAQPEPTPQEMSAQECIDILLETDNKKRLKVLELFRADAPGTPNDKRSEIVNQLIVTSKDYTGTQDVHKYIPAYKALSALLDIKKHDKEFDEEITSFIISDLNVVDNEDLEKTLPLSFVLIGQDFDSRLIDPLLDTIEQIQTILDEAQDQPIEEFSQAAEKIHSLRTAQANFINFLETPPRTPKKQQSFEQQPLQEIS